MLEELGYDQNGATILHEDNQGCIKMAENDVFSKRTRHIDIRHHFVREHIAKGLIEMKYVPTATQLADALTKALERVLHNRFVASVMYDTAVKEKFMRVCG